jgi:hypothetical protein
MFPNHPGRCRQSYGCTPVVPGRIPDHPGRLPGLCRDVSETVALWYNKDYYPTTCASKQKGMYKINDR